MASPRLAISSLAKNLLSPRSCISPRKIDKSLPSPRKKNYGDIIIKKQDVPFNVNTPNRKKIVNNELSNEKRNLLGCGGFGTVYKATYQGNQVAIKILKRTNFHDIQVEAEKRASFLQHPNIVKIIGIEQGTVWSLITMELCVMSLQGKLDETKLPLITRIKIWSAIASALEFCHNAGIVHADVKSKNILIAPDGQPKLSDFGSSIMISKSFERNKFRGTPGYVPPEVIKGDIPTPKSDVYSLGIVAWQLISRKVPFATFHPHTALYLTGKGVRPRDDDIDDECNGIYKNIYQKCWSQNQETRPNFDEIIFQLNYLLKKMKV